MSGGGVWREKLAHLMAETRESGGWEEEVGGVMVVEEVEWKMKKNKRLNHWVKGLDFFTTPVQLRSDCGEY
ncbi:hypothetical protein Tco_0144074 [Tanacetum coccineum]